MASQAGHLVLIQIKCSDLVEICSFKSPHSDCEQLCNGKLCGNGKRDL